MAKTTKKKGPPGPSYVPKVQAPAKFRGAKAQLPKVGKAPAFRKPGAPPTKVHQSKRLAKLVAQAEKDIREGRTEPMFDENGTWFADKPGRNKRERYAGEQWLRELDELAQRTYGVLGPPQNKTVAAPRHRSPLSTTTTKQGKK